MESINGWLNPITIGAFLGMTGVILGAFGSHALQSELTSDRFDAFETAVRYQMFHSILLVALGLSQYDFSTTVIGSFAGGVVLFSGSIYLLVLTDTKKLGMVTPVGGTLLIVAWGLLLWSGLKKF